MGKMTYIFGAQKGMDRAARDLGEEPTSVGCLATITSATAISGSTTRWVYQWSEAEIGPAASNYPVASKTGGITGAALSISELGNGTYFAFGITAAALPAGWTPVKIPNGTPVWVVPHRGSDGTLVWVILNTQAIDGACT
jgi:hypothetical protein